MQSEREQTLIGGAKRAPHWGVQSRFRVIYYWASEVSPTLGCSIEISRDILLGERSEPHTGVFNRDFAWYVGRYVCMSVVCQINCVGGITCGPRACSKSYFLAVKPVTPVLFISYTLEL